MAKEIIKCEGFNQNKIPQPEFLRQFKILCNQHGVIIQHMVSGDYTIALVMARVTPPQEGV